MLSRQGLAGSPLRLVSGRVPVSARFGDQLIAVLPRLRRFARGLSGSIADADDLVQAACERALARQHQFQEGTRFDSWMFRIVQTIWIDQVRARDVRKEGGDIAEDRLGSDEPVRRVEARLALAEVRRALDRLPSTMLGPIQPNRPEMSARKKIASAEAPSSPKIQMQTTGSPTVSSTR